VECDGSFSASLNGNPNPILGIDVTDSATTNLGADIVIDNLNNAGAAVGANADVQIMVLGQNTAALDPDEFILTSELQLTNSLEFAGASGLKGAYAPGGSVCARSNGTAGSFREYWGPPAGWQ
jgi:hypothetical protein